MLALAGKAGTDSSAVPPALIRLGQKNVQLALRSGFCSVSNQSVETTEGGEK